MRKIVIASDHAGFRLKELLKSELLKLNFNVDDKGTFTEESVDYPDFAHKLAFDVNTGIADIGIVICGSGNGVNMTVNKYENIRSALCWNEEIAKLARLHNDANVIALPARFISDDTAKKCLEIFLNTEFEGGRHLQRVKKIPIKRNE
jgi:ribose 5-phosphate isomerase B